jgi:hypothetical protein
MTIATPLTRDAMRRQDEKELFEALDVGLKTAAAAAGAIAYARQEGRWSQIKFLLESILEKANALRDGRQRPNLVLPASVGFNDTEH